MSNIKEDSGAIAPAAVNSVGAGGMGSTSQGPIQGYDPFLEKPKKKKLRDIVRRKMPNG